MKIGKFEVNWHSVCLRIYFNIANIVSIFRIICAPIVTIMMGCALYQFIRYGRTIWPAEYSFFLFYTFLGAVLSDWLDGFLAWLLEIFSRWGAFLDRIADKLLIVPNVILMTAYYLVLAFWFVSLLSFPIAGLLLTMIYLEYLLAKWGLKGFREKAPIESNLRGKTKMVLQCTASLYWTLGLLFPDSEVNLFGISWFLNPSSTFNLVAMLIVLVVATGFAFGSITGYKSLPEYKKMLGENNN